MSVKRQPEQRATRQPGGGACCAARACLLVLLAAWQPVLADLIETVDRRMLDGSIATVSDDGVRTVAGALVPWANVRRVLFDRTAVPASETRLLLRDGSIVSGVVRRLTQARITFRSVALGEMDLGVDQIAAVQLAAKSTIRAVRDASATNVVAILRSGPTRSGSLVFASASNVLIKTPDGLEKLAFENLSGLVFDRIPPPGGPGVVLRNGDVLCGVPQWSGTGLKASAGGVAVTISLDAVAEIRR